MVETAADELAFDLLRKQIGEARTNAVSGTYEYLLSHTRAELSLLDRMDMRARQAQAERHAEARAALNSFENKTGLRYPQFGGMHFPTNALVSFAWLAATALAIPYFYDAPEGITPIWLLPLLALAALMSFYGDYWDDAVSRLGRTLDEIKDKETDQMFD